MTVKTFSFGKAFGTGWEKLREHWVFLIGSALLIFVASGLFGYLADGPYKGIEPTSGLLSLIGFLLRVWLNFNLLVITIRIFDGVKPKWSDLFVWREETLPYAGASFLYGVMIFFGLIAFVIPGLYFAVKYSFYGFLIADKRVGAFDALKMSGQLTEGVRWLLIGFTSASIGIIILGAVALGVGLLVALPVVSLAFVAVYRSLYDQTFDLAAATPAAVVATPLAASVPTTPAIVTPAVPHTPVTEGKAENVSVETKAEKVTEDPKPETPATTPPTV